MNLALKTLLESLETAIQHHADWLKALHRSLLCNEASNDVIHDLNNPCALGEWYRMADHPLQLTRQRGFRHLRKSLPAMHRAASRMLNRRLRDGKVDGTLYDLFARHAERVNRNLRDLQLTAMQQAVQIDPLTSISNRFEMLPTLAQRREQLIKSGLPGCICMMDLDHFKRINDQHGHMAGDAVLRQVAECVTHLLRPNDLVFRYGGEEFLIFLSAVNTQAAANIIERTRQTINQLGFNFGSTATLHISASWGLAALHADAQIIQTIHLADMALYAAKRSGRNCLVIADVDSPSGNMKLRAWPLSPSE